MGTDRDLARSSKVAGKMRAQRRTACVVILSLTVAAVAVGVWQLSKQFALARERARRASCLSNVKSLGLSFLMYVRDNDDHMPPAGRPGDGYFWVPYLLGDQTRHRPRYFAMGTSALLCPSVLRHEDERPHPWGSATPPSRSFAYVVRDPPRYVDYEVEPLLAGRGVRDLPADRVVLAWDKRPVHLGGRCYCHLDGHAQWSKEEAFRKALADSRRLLQSEAP